jgi:hypothetical protein
MRQDAAVAWLMHPALNRRFILIARTARGTRKLIVGLDVASESIERFLTDVRFRESSQVIV